MHLHHWQALKRTHPAVRAEKGYEPKSHHALQMTRMALQWLTALDNLVGLGLSLVIESDIKKSSVRE